MDYEQVCKHITDISTRFNSRISDVDVSNLTSIESCSDSRVRYTAYYVFFSNKRIQDILRIENKKLNKNRILNFKTLLFKERLLSCSKIENSINFKYKKLI
jgi:hypothetical protein